MACEAYIPYFSPFQTEIQTVDTGKSVRAVGGDYGFEELHVPDDTQHEKISDDKPNSLKDHDSDYYPVQHKGCTWKNGKYGVSDEYSIKNDEDDMEDQKASKWEVKIALVTLVAMILILQLAMKPKMQGRRNFSL